MLSLSGATCLELNAGPGSPISLSHPHPNPTVGTLFTGWVHLDEPQGYPYDSSLLHTSPYAFTFDLLTGATSRSWIASASSSALPTHPFPAFAPLGGGTHKGPHPGATQFPLCAYTDTQLDPAHIPFAYSFALLAPVEGSASPHPAPKSWELQGSRGGATGWVTLDTRKNPSSTGGVLSSTSPEEPWVAFIPPHATGMGFTALRLIVRDVVGARGSHSVVWPSPGGVTLTSAQVWMAPPPPPPPVPPAMPPSPPCLLPVCLPGWIVSVSGSWGCRRLRVTTSDGAIDCVSVGVLDTHEGSPGFYLGVGVGTGEGERGEWHWHVEVHINGRPVLMKSVEECIRAEPLSSCPSTASISSSSSSDGGGSLIINHYRKALNVDLLQEGGGLVEEECTPSVAAEGGSGSGGGGGCHPAPPPSLTWSHPSTTTTLVLGGALGKEAVTLAVQRLQQQQDSAAPLPQWLYIRNHLTPFTPLAPKGALARDAPRDLTTPPLRGALARLSLVQCGPLPPSTPSPPTWRALREALTGLYREVITISGRGGERLPSHRRQSNLFPRYPPFTQPFHTLEGMALWQPFPPSSSLPPPIRPRYPPHTIGACTSITITSGGGSAGGKEGGIHTTPPLGAFARGCASGHLSPHKPITLLCHDCGPSVYIEDVWEGGTPVRPLPLLPAQQGGGQQEGQGHKQQPPLPLPRSSPFFALPPMQPSTTPIPPPPFYYSPTQPPTHMGHAARFEHALAHSDFFAYFSHARVSPPPPSWVAACHAAGVAALGTLCTEWEDGEVGNEALGAPMGKAMSNYARAHGFDGWLVNIEAAMLDTPATASSRGCGGSEEKPLGPGDVAPSLTKLMDFLAQLRGTGGVGEGGEGDPLTTVWYDSIHAHTGRVGWVSALCPTANGPFFAATDALFTDYHWTPQGLGATVAAAATAAAAAANSSRHPRDVLVGCDVWGRGGWGGGGWATAVAAGEATARGLSTALFAPAWVWEEGGGREGGIGVARAGEEKLWWGELPPLTPPPPPKLAAALEDMGKEEERAQPSAADVGWKAFPPYPPSSSSASLGRKGGLKNPHGFLLPPSTRGVLVESGGGGVECARATGLWGWREEVEGRGGGWTVTECDRVGWEKRDMGRKATKAVMSVPPFPSSPPLSIIAESGGEKGDEEGVFLTAVEFFNAQEREEEEVEDEGGRNGAAAAATIPSFVSSFTWSKASQTLTFEVPLAPAAGAPRAAPGVAYLVAQDWVKGTGPNFSDLYQLTLSACVEGMRKGEEQRGDCWVHCESGEVVCGEEWVRVLCCLAVPLPPAAPTPTTGNNPPHCLITARLTRAGKDVEYWAGHFGACARGARVGIVVKAGEREGGGEGASTNSSFSSSLLPPLTLSRAVGGPRSACSTLPFKTSWNCGAGGRRWWEGSITSGGASLKSPPPPPSKQEPWVNIGEQEPLPCRLGRKAWIPRSHWSAQLNLCSPVGGAGESSNSSSGNSEQWQPWIWGASSSPPLTHPSVGDSSSGGDSDSPHAAPLGLSLVHHTAWKGGGCLLVSGQPQPQEAALIVLHELCIEWGGSATAAAAATRDIALDLVYQPCHTCPSNARWSPRLLVEQQHQEEQQQQPLLLAPSESRPVVGIGVGGWGCSSHTFSNTSFIRRIVGVGLLLEGGGLEGRAGGFPSPATAAKAFPTPPPPLPFALLGELHLFFRSSS